MKQPPVPRRVAQVGPRPPSTASVPGAPERPATPARPGRSPRPARPDRPAKESRPAAPSRSSEPSSAAPAERDERALVPAASPFLPPVRRSTIVPGSAERFAERVAMRRRLTRRKVVWTAATVGALAVVAWVLFWSPVLALHVAEVQVVGEGTVVDPAAVMAAVTPLDGTPLPRLDTVELRRQVLDVPGVRAAEVARLWPHGLRITVVSREPVAAVPATSGDGFVLLDVEGVQVGRATAPPAGLPVIAVPVGDDTRAMTAVLAVLQGLPPDLAAQVSAASADSEDTVRLTLADGAQVEWGSADQPALKARVLATLRAAPASAGAAVYDVSAPTLPITRAQP